MELVNFLITHCLGVVGRSTENYSMMLVKY